MNKSKVVDVKEKSLKTKVIAIAITAVVVILLFVSSLAIVPAGSTGVVTTFGKVSENTYSEGFHLKIPFAQDVVIISNKIQVYETDASAVSNDLQTVNSTISVNFRVKNDSSASIYKNIGSDYQTVVLMPAVQESMKAITAKYTAEELITERNSVGEEIKEQLSEKVSDYGIQIEKINIVNFEFSAEFNEAIEQKQVAEQNKLKAETEKEQKIIEAEAEAEQITINAEANAEATKTEAQAQAEANELLSESLTQSLVDYMTIQKWDGEMPEVASSANPIIALDITDEESDADDSSSEQTESAQEDTE
ncbi:MAG: prohibitin family protein [Ruminococcus sp.]|nr:prohibitin family protein [Ruminococcus sp.]